MGKFISQVDEDCGDLTNSRNYLEHAVLWTRNRKTIDQNMTFLLVYQNELYEGLEVSAIAVPIAELSSILSIPNYTIPIARLYPRYINQ